jgi:2-hydroxycyclohexanecarboxyl-CoA dehydrogenase
LTSEKAARGAVEDIEGKFGPIGYLVNSIGWVGSTRFADEKSEYWRKVISINFESVLFLMHASLSRMIRRRQGRIVNIASDAGRVGTSGEAVYSGLKAGIIGVSKSIARENARFGITVNCVSPGPTDTPLLVEYRREQPELYERMLKQIPLRRVATPHDIAGVVAFLLSREADYMTGQTISVSGGLTMI